LNEDGTINQITYDFCQAMFLILLTMAIDMIVNWPLSLFKTFMIQESHGFNNQTLGGWFKDALLGVMLSVIL
jgi:STE24 endopeptidase